MIAKTVTGSDFVGAIEYGAGIRSGRDDKKAVLIGVANLGGKDPAQIAAEMKAVADQSRRIARPVLHTSLAWAPGEQVSREQMVRAATRYCELMGANPADHQIAIYEHRDKPHPHCHIYINRVPISGGAALHLGHNYARNMKATATIREELGMTPLPERRTSLKDHNAKKQGVKKYVHAQLATAMNDPRVTSIGQLTSRLEEHGVAAEFKRDSNGVLVGASFRYQETAVKGTEVGFKARQLRDQYEPHQQPAPRIRTQTSAAGRSQVPASSGGVGEGPGAAPEPASPEGRHHDQGAGILDALVDAATDQTPTEDPRQNENVARRKRKLRVKL